LKAGIVLINARLMINNMNEAAWLANAEYRGEFDTDRHLC